MKMIELTQGQTTLVDDWNYEKENKHSWRAQWNEDTQSFYAVRDEGKRPFRKTIRMHREIMNTPDDMICDHINHDTLNNLESNLRNVSHSQSQMNRRLHSNNNLGDKNIRQRGLGFSVSIKVSGEYVYIKTFRTIEEARIARDEAVKKYHGDFSYSPEQDQS